MIYTAMCGERLWADHYGDGRHRLRQEATPVPKQTADGQDDLTADDRLVEQTEKVFPADNELPQPSQDPSWVPRSTVDENGNPA